MTSPILAEAIPRTRSSDLCQLCCWWNPPKVATMGASWANHRSVRWPDPRNSRSARVTLAPESCTTSTEAAQCCGPGATFGWHSHPGPTIVTVLSGTLSFYHAEACTHRINYTAGQSFSNLPDEIHLARNEGAVDLVVYATYFVPVGTGPLRIDQPSPGADCPL